MTIRLHPNEDCTEDCYGCKLSSVQFDQGWMPTRDKYKISQPPRTPEPAWERGIPTDNRGMPWLRKDGSPMGIKEYSEKRSVIEATKREWANPPTETNKD